ncbi:MAG: hypothetical protein J0M26_18470 [Planctomycetes bacterium]|nr:hypothetical protein [Planctomycetota bacterium]
MSASPNWLNDDCISSVDYSLMFALEADPERHWTILSNHDEAKLWESRLVQLADKAYLKMTREYERSLEIRLANEFAMFDRYVEELGDMHQFSSPSFVSLKTLVAGSKASSIFGRLVRGRTGAWSVTCCFAIRANYPINQYPIQICGYTIRQRYERYYT